MSINSDCDWAREITALESLKLDELRLRWHATFGKAAPSYLPKPLLLRLFCYRLQAEAFEDLSPATLQLLERLGQTKGGSDTPVPLPSEVGRQGLLKPGTVLVREHEGVSHHVMAVENGFAWNGRTFHNLSQVAKAITGTQWNGPRFFGLRDGKAPV